MSVEDEGGELLIVSQFTLYGDARKGNRPSFINSSSADKAEEYYEILIKELKDDGFNAVSYTHLLLYLQKLFKSIYQTSGKCK